MDGKSIPTHLGFVLAGAIAVGAIVIAGLLGATAGATTDAAGPSAPIAVPTNVTINAVADAYVDNGKLNDNYGDSADLYVSLYGSPVNIQQTLARFSLAAIPAGATIDEARFELYLSAATGSSSVTLSLGRNTLDWKRKRGGVQQPPSLFLKRRDGPSRRLEGLVWLGCHCPGG